MNKALRISLYLVGSAAIILLLTQTETISYSIQNPGTDNSNSFELFNFDSHIYKEFIGFIARHKKNYPTWQHHNHRFSIFKENYLKAHSHNQKNKSFQMGINKFSDLSEEEFLEAFANPFMENEFDSLTEARSLNEHPSLTSRIKRDEKGRYIDTRSQEGHDFMDYNDYVYLDSLKVCSEMDWPLLGKVSKVKNQLTCGSCWAHSALATVETEYAKKNKIYDTGEVLSFSEQQLVDCNFIPNLGCFGGKSQYALDYIMRQGITTDDRYPYIDDQNEECLYNEEEDKVFDIDMFKVYEYMTNEDLKRLVCRGTVSVNVRINDCIKMYEEGVIFDGEGDCDCSGQQTTNHAVAVVGFGVDFKNPDCKQYWRLKNSWGTDWGENGFYRLCIDENNSLPFGTCLLRMNPMISIKF